MASGKKEIRTPIILGRLLARCLGLNGAFEKERIPCRGQDMLKSVLRTPPSITAFIKLVPVLSPSGQLELFKFIPDEFVPLCTPRLSMRR